MSEQNPEPADDRQDPAEQYQTDQAVDTETQDDPPADVVSGGESASTEVTPEQPENDTAVTVAPAEPEGDLVVRDNVQYRVTPEGGHRRV
jgi:hypothetical protein